MEKVNERETSYGILMSRVLVGPDVYMYKPVSVIEGVLHNVDDYKIFVDKIGNTYLMSTDAQSLSCDDELSVAYIISEDDLLTKYGDISLLEAVDNYSIEMINNVHIGIYDPLNNSVFIMRFDLSTVKEMLSKGISIKEQTAEQIDKDKEMLSKALSDTSGDNLIFVTVERFKKLLEMKEYKQLHDELQSMFNEIEETNEYFGIETENCEIIQYNEKAIFNLFDECYTHILSINDVEEIKCTIQYVLDAYYELSNLEEYKNKSKCQTFLEKKMSGYMKLLELDSISEIKKGILEIKKDEVHNIQRIIEKSKEVIVTDIDKLEKVNKIIDVKAMKDYMDKKIIGQEEAKRDVIEAIVLNDLSENKRDKNVCLLIGPTGSGKTLVAETASEFLDRPMQVFDTTQLTMPGYKGGDIEDFLVRLLGQTNGDVKKAENAIVVFDEIDKKGSDDHSDVSGKGVLDTLLSFIQGTTYDVKYNGRTILFDTSKLTFIATGAFTDVAEAKKIRTKSMGFSAKIEDNEEDITYPELTIKDLVTIGKIPRELAGRFTTITQLKGHTKETLKQIILDCDNSVLLQEQVKLKKLGIDIKWTEGFIDAVVDKAFELQTGARSLKNILEKSIKKVRWEALYDLGFYTTIVLTKDTVNDNEMCQLCDYKGNVYNLKDIIKEREQEKPKVKKIEKGN